MNPDACNYRPAANESGTCIYEGDPCNDGIPDTVNDKYDANCNCFGEFSCCTDSQACNYNPNATGGDGCCEYEDCNGNCEGSVTIGSSCNDGIPDTINDKYDANCNCFGEFSCCTDSQACNYNPNATGGDGCCEYIDCNGVCGGSATIGSRCDDFIPETTDDKYDSDCNCFGTVEVPPIIGCMESDACNYNPSANQGGTCIYEGDPCDDRIPETINDKYVMIDGNCNCIGTPTGGCTTGDDCDDGNPITTNEVYDADCNCCEILVSSQSGFAAQHNWSMFYEISEDDGMVLENIYLGPRKMVERLSIPYLRLSTAFNDDEIVRLELKNSCDSKLTSFNIIESDEKLSLVATYKIGNIKNNPTSVLEVTQRYEFEPLPEDNSCEPEEIKYWILDSGIDLLSPLETPCNVFRFTVEYRFVGDDGGNIFVDIPQRIHTKVDDLAKNHVRFFKDFDFNGLIRIRSIPEGIISPIDESFYVNEEKLVVGILNGKKADIDNFHLSSDSEILGPTVVDPGCPECIHVHWRWSNLIEDEELGGGAPIIPEGSNQDLRIGIVKYDEDEIDPFSTWQDLINPSTKLINDGFVIWYGSSGYQKSDKFFIHDGFFLTEFIDLAVNIKLDEEKDAIPYQILDEDSSPPEVLSSEFTFEVELTNNGFAKVQDVNLELRLSSAFVDIINVGICEFDETNLKVNCKKTVINAGEKATFPITIKIPGSGIFEIEELTISASVSGNSNLFDSNTTNNFDEKKIKFLQPIDLNIDCFVQNNNTGLEIDEEGIIEFIINENSDFLNNVVNPKFEVCLTDKIRPLSVTSENGVCVVNGQKIICSYLDNPGKRGKSNNNYKNIVEFDRVTLRVEGGHPGEAEIIASIESLSPEAFPDDNIDTLILNVLPGDNLFLWYQDLDEDDLGNPLVDSLSTSPPDGYVFNDNDTDDTCNGIHDECGICNGEGPGIWFQDLDGDGLGNLEIAREACSKPIGFVENYNDDNDNEECRGELDECGICNGTGTTIWYQDLDGDGLGNINVTLRACIPPNGYVANTNDDNDNEECHGELDECGICNGNGAQVWFQDLDGDGFGSNINIFSCKRPYGYVYNNYDGDDTCQGEVPWFQDLDGDGEGNPLISVISCLPPNGFVSNNTDDNDNEECQGEFDKCGICNGIGGEIYYEDSDGDGLGNPESWLLACDKPAGYVENFNDTDELFPCDGVRDECGVCNGSGAYYWYQDLDGDGLGNALVDTFTCLQPEGYVNNILDLDDSIFNEPNVFNLSINDPCICDMGIDLNGNGQVDLVQEEITVVGGLAPYTVIASSNNFYDTMGNLYNLNDLTNLLNNSPNNTALVYVFADGQSTHSVTVSDSAGNQATVNGGPCPLCGPNEVAAIPTLSQWGIIILLLLILTTSGVFIIRQQHQLASAGLGSPSFKLPLVNWALFNKILIKALLFVVVVIALITLFEGAFYIRNVIGSFISSFIIIYLVHFVVMSERFGKDGQS